MRWRTTCDYGTASSLVQAARRLADLPQLSGLLAAGDITLSHTTAVTRAAVPSRAAAIAEAEPILAELARTNPPADVRRAVRHLADTVDDDGSTPDDDPPGDPLRELHLRTGFQGHGDLEATLDPLTREALQVLLDAFHTADPADTPDHKRRSAAQRRHDAFAALLHTLLAQPGLPSVQGARPQILISIDLTTLLGLPDDHPLAGASLADLAAAAGIDLAELGLALDGDSSDGTAAHGEGGVPTADTPDVDASGAAGARPPRSTPRRGARFGSGVRVEPALVRGLLPAAPLMAVLTLGPWRGGNRRAHGPNNPATASPKAPSPKPNSAQRRPSPAEPTRRAGESVGADGRLPAGRVTT
jgi:hypothetical protein